MICPAIHIRTSCEIQTVIHFLHTKTVSAMEINRELFVVVYGRNVMSEGTVDIGVERLKMGRCTNVQDEGQCGPPSVVFKELSKNL
jgi:hypothetical protein